MWASDAEFPSDKEAYLGVKGTFDQGEEYGMEDFYTTFERNNITGTICPNHEVEQSDYRGGRWWDRFRAESVSPFDKACPWVKLELSSEIEFSGWDDGDDRP